MIREFVAVWGPAVVISLGTFAVARVMRPKSPAWPPARARRNSRPRGRYRVRGAS